jgi:hypothetical protein
LARIKDNAALQLVIRDRRSQRLSVRLEIAKAVRALAEDQQEGLRQRQVEIASLRREWEEIARDFSKLRREWLILVRSELCKYGYNPEEPRIPEHHAGGGRWTRLAGSDDPNNASDTPPFPRQPYADGHHWVPKTVFQKRNFSAETEAVFEKSTSGPLADRTVNFNNIEHRRYNDAVEDLLDAFLERNKITAEQMTPVQAREFIQEVIGSSDPRIREFVIKIRQEVYRYIRRYGPWRGGGGDED